MRYRFVALVLLAIAVGTHAFGQRPPVELVEGGAFLLTWKQPAYPPSLLAEKVEGQVVVEFVVAEDGSVTHARAASSSDSRFDEAALDSVRAWTFEPAVANGNKVASGLVVPVLFRLEDARRKSQALNPPVMPRDQEFVSVKVQRYASPLYPSEFEARQLAGSVDLRFSVTTDGRPTRVRVLGTASPELVRPALDALARSEFIPARQGEAKREAELVAPFEFSQISFEKADVLAANGIRPVEGATWADSTGPPRPGLTVEPVYPHDALLARRAGSAEVAFTITMRGTVQDAEVLSASEPEFGEALAAAVVHWGFRPASKREGFAESRVVMTHTFTPPGQDSPLSPEIGRLVGALNADPAAIGTASNLDQRLTPVWQVQPVRPADYLAQTEAAEAVIDFIIDRDGRARLPKIVRSTLPSVGWAAATAVSCWVFERPTRNGEPVDVRVSIPIRFPRP